MSFMDKVKFWEKKDDFSNLDSSFDDSSFNTTNTGLPPQPTMDNTTPDSFAQPTTSQQDPFATPTPGGAYDDEFAIPKTTSQDSMIGQNSFNNNTIPSFNENPQQPPKDPSIPQNPFARPAPPPHEHSLGKSLAQNYIQGQEQPAPTQQPAQQNANMPSDEMISLKLDAIRSELSAISQRLIRLEHTTEQQNKKRGW